MDADDPGPPKPPGRFRWLWLDVLVFAVGAAQAVQATAQPWLLPWGIAAGAYAALLLYIGVSRAPHLAWRHFGELSIIAGAVLLLLLVVTYKLTAAGIAFHRGVGFSATAMVVVILHGALLRGLMTGALYIPGRYGRGTTYRRDRGPVGFFIASALVAALFVAVLAAMFFELHQGSGRS